MDEWRYRVMSTLAAILLFASVFALKTRRFPSGPHSRYFADNATFYILSDSSALICENSVQMLQLSLQ